MQSTVFISLFNESISFLSEEWKSKYGELLHDEHWSIIVERVFDFTFNSEIKHYSFPVFNEEIIWQSHKNIL